MKAVMIILDQAHYSQIIDDLSKLNIRGGSHAWPSVNNAVLAVVEDHRVGPLMDYLRELDKAYENLGLRAFVWNVEDMI